METETQFGIWRLTVSEDDGIVAVTADGFDDWLFRDIGDAASILAVLATVSEKPEATSEILADLVRALNEKLDFHSYSVPLDEDGNECM